MIKHHEFWHPRIFELPYYVSLLAHTLMRGMTIKSLAKANYTLDHGEIGLGSKYQTQQAFDQSYFLPTVLLKAEASIEEKKQQVDTFLSQYGYPVILKSDVGCVGKGLCKLDAAEDVENKLPLLQGDFILQQFTPFEHEYGIFFVRQQGKSRITGINEKHFPGVVGNGHDSLLTLAKQHERYTQHWPAFLQSIDTDRVPAKGEKVRLSFIGSHTLGCKFTDDTHLVSPALEAAIFKFFDSQPGYNFGRCDVKAQSEVALLAGEFVVIEVNGIASLPTHMFDPSYSLCQAYKIFLEHAKYLATIAKEHQYKDMNLLGYRDIIGRVKSNQQLLNAVHECLKGEA